jgi:hypothetical protein
MKVNKMEDNIKINITHREALLLLILIDKSPIVDELSNIRKNIWENVDAQLDINLASEYVVSFDEKLNDISKYKKYCGNLPDYPMSVRSALYEEEQKKFKNKKE